MSTSRRFVRVKKSNEPPIEEEEEIEDFQVRRALRGLQLCSKPKKTMLIMRGPSSCGKTYLAEKIISHLEQNSPAALTYGRFSTNDLMEDDEGNYKFDATNIIKHHAKNLKDVVEAMDAGTTVVIIDNPNINPSDARPYILNADLKDYRVRFVDPHTPWDHDVDFLASPEFNKHEVPIHIIQSQVKNYRTYSLDEARKAPTNRSSKLTTTDHDDE
jgi:nicotinamide riboside kinase